MKVCFISPYSSRGGAELSLVELIDALLPLGIQCSCVVRSHGAMSELLEERGVETIITPFKLWVHSQKSYLGRARRLLPLGHVAGTYRLVSAIRRSHCDLVYTNSITAGVGAVAARIARKPHIWHLREFGYDDYKLSYDFGEDASRGLMRRLSSACIANSYAVAEAYRPYLAGTELNVVYNSVDMPVTGDGQVPNNAWRHDDAIRCLLLGKYISGKGQEDAVRAIVALRKMKVPAELLLVGETLDKKYRERIERMVKEFDLTDRVRLLGHCGDPTPLMRTADVVLMCSRREAFGRVTVEGMKLGKAVIGTRSGGTPEILQDGETGFLYRPGDFSELANKIAHLHAHPEVRDAVGTNASLQARMRFSQANYGADVANVIWRVMSLHHPAGEPSTEAATIIQGKFIRRRGSSRSLGQTSVPSEAHATPTTAG